MFLVGVTSKFYIISASRELQPRFLVKVALDENWDGTKHSIEILVRVELGSDPTLRSQVQILSETKILLKWENRNDRQNRVYTWPARFSHVY